MGASIILSTLVALVLIGCGGGGGGGSTRTDIPQSPSFPLPIVAGDGQLVGDSHYSTAGTSQRNSDARHSPVYSHGNFLQAGVDQGRRIANLPSVAKRGDTTVRHGRLADGVGSSALSSYLADGVGPTVRRYNTAPEVRVIGAATAADIEVVTSTVRLLNAALPEDAKMRMGSHLPGFSLRDTVRSSGRRFVSGRELDNTIHVEFIPSGQFYSDAGATSWSHFGDGVENSYIQFNRGANVYQDENSRRRVILLAHEIMHALGVYGYDHVSVTFDTIMEGTGDIYDLNQGTQQPRSILYPVDREALRAIHSRLDNGDDPTEFGPWSSVSRHVIGNDAHANFGVALRNGYAEPWAYGYKPITDLANNRTLGGRATWIGTLLGFTPQESTVTGDAQIGVNLSTMAGHADFTELESFPAGQAPGEEGTGSRWLDGDLGYSISVRGNTFRETGGDDGRITGIFTGHRHEGAAGTLERSDLTAAFGASRQ